MAGREIALFLKCPGSLAVQRLRHSFLECVVEYKTGSYLDLQTKTPLELRTEFQLSGTASLVDDEIVIHFQSRCTGIHVARIFAHTRELCRPITFKVTEKGTVESLASNQPVGVPEPPPPLLQQQRSTASVHSANSPQSQSLPDSPQRSPASVVESEPTSIRHSRDLVTPERATPERATPRDSTAGSCPGSTCEPYSGDLLSSTPGVYSFSELYAMKQKGVSIETGMKLLDHASVITADAFKLIKRGVTNHVAKQMGKKIQCSICSRTVKSSKTISLLQTEYCEHCFRRQFIIRSVTDHFMVPRVEYCGVEVPVNKKATKFVTAMMTIPQVNLRGLDFVDVRTAQKEFAKFSIENNGWLDKHLILPLIKPCLLTQHFNEEEVKNTLCSQALTSLIRSYGMERRSLVHEIEFLSLLAYSAREAQSFKSLDGANAAKSKFTRADLELAYAYRKELIIKSRSLRDSAQMLDKGSVSHDHTHSRIPKKQTSTSDHHHHHHHQERSHHPESRGFKKSPSYEQESIGSEQSPAHHQQQGPSPHPVITTTPAQLSIRQNQMNLQGLTDPIVRKKASTHPLADTPATHFKFPSPNAVSVFPVQSYGVGERTSVQVPKHLFERRRQQSNASNLEGVIPNGENSLPEAEQGFALSGGIQHINTPTKPNEEFKLTDSSADGWMMY